MCYNLRMNYSKYHNKKTEYNGISFMSKKEAGYARTLDALKWAKDLFIKTPIKGFLLLLV